MYSYSLVTKEHPLKLSVICSPETSLFTSYILVWTL